MTDILNTIANTRAISILRGIPHTHINATVDALYAGGIRCIEITMDSPKALHMIEQVREHYGDRMLIGAGTVLDEATARSAILAGADFVLAPTLSTDMIELCNTYGKLAVPGVFTPSEALTAAQAGALLVKVFPVRALGPSYISDMLGPLPQLRLLPVGGVDEHNARAYIDAGAFAVGLGSCLANKKQVLAGEYPTITASAQQLIKSLAV